MTTRTLAEATALCDTLAGVPGFPDYPGACNGLQVENSGEVTRVGAAVDADLATLETAATRGIDFLIVHHGLLWTRPTSYTGVLRRKLALLLENNVAVYGAHLPLDAHPELGNNAILVRRLGLTPVTTFLPFEGRDIGILCAGLPRVELAGRLRALFPAGVTAIEGGPEVLQRVAVCSGGAGSHLLEAKAAGADAFITGEAQQHHYGQALEAGLNLYLAGHYATEVFGVQALAEAVAGHLGLPWEFIPSGCPL
jgi:dinuclear metal center YbgI/SA1388 family protein